MSIVVENISVTYPVGRTEFVNALTDVSLTIEDQEFIGVMGKTGSGKTTLVEIIAGLIAPTSGRVFLDGKDINEKGFDRGKLRKSVGIVFQFPEFQIFERSVKNDVAFGLKHSGLTEDEKEKRIQWSLETMGFNYETIKDIHPLTLSGGEKRRVAIAGVLAVRPNILILDEPIAGLDPSARIVFLETLRQLCQEGMTVIMISHDAEAISEYSERTLIFDNGRLAADEKTRSLFGKPALIDYYDICYSAPVRLAESLRKGGFPISEGAIQYEEVLNAIADEIKRRKSK